MCDNGRPAVSLVGPRRGAGRQARIESKFGLTRRINVHTCIRPTTRYSTLFDSIRETFGNAVRTVYQLWLCALISSSARVLGTAPLNIYSGVQDIPKSLKLGEGVKCYSRTGAQPSPSLFGLRRGSGRKTRIETNFG